jgi:hypothetical protein
MLRVAVALAQDAFLAVYTSGTASGRTGRRRLPAPQRGERRPVDASAPGEKQTAEALGLRSGSVKGYASRGLATLRGPLAGDSSSEPNDGEPAHRARWSGVTSMMDDDQQSGALRHQLDREPGRYAPPTWRGRGSRTRWPGWAPGSGMAALVVGVVAVPAVLRSDEGRAVTPRPTRSTQIPRAPVGGDRVEVSLPVRPNGSRGRVAAANVTLATTPYRLVVSRGAPTGRGVPAGRGVPRAGVGRYPVGVGRSMTPTPTGTSFLTELTQPPDPHGVHGPHAFGMSAFSDTLTSFAGGPGPLELRGADAPAGSGAT